jgi:phosphoribosylformylglycinamidine synthase
VASAHDCSDGGLAVALAECTIGDEERWLGAEIDLSAWDALPRRALLFGEAQARVVVSSADAVAVLATAARHGVPARVIGTVRDAEAGLTLRIRGSTWTAASATLADAYHGAIPRLMDRAATAATLVAAAHHVTP